LGAALTEETEGFDRVVQTWGSSRLQLGEGVRWVGDRVVLVDIVEGLLLEAQTSTGPQQVLAKLDVPLGAVAPVVGRPHSWIAAAGTGVGLLDEDGGLRWIDRPEDRTPLRTRMNDAVADPLGRFWAGSMAWDKTEGAGRLYRVDCDGTVSAVLDGLTIPNGPAFSSDGTVMYLADTPRRTIYRLAVDPGDGALSEQEVFAEITDPVGNPDGMTVDDDGLLWVALWGAGLIRRFAADGSVDRDVPLPVAQPASVCLDGAGTMWVATARIELDDPQPTDGALLRTPVEINAPAAAAYIPTWL